mmetsp:Transcript_16174/g.33850  ORF Transcript_16174/g.33850 Transcript_16174/m.33850 type:complete len:490 (-) Transcript_16174:211-1680(-)
MAATINSNVGCPATSSTSEARMNSDNIESNPDNEESCPICLNSMSNPDILHPIVCPTACNFNFCINCLSSLLASSKDDYEMASDGNRHVKIHLNCPNCRADISGCTEDTIRLRRAALAIDMQKIPDSELSAKELQAKYWTEGDGLLLESDLKKETKNDGLGEELPGLAIDTSLFGGLEYFMSDQEQRFVTKLMTSGYPDQLCQAAQILAGISDLLRKGITPSMRAASNNHHNNTAANNAQSNTAARTAAAHATALRNARSNTTIGANSSRGDVRDFQKQREAAARAKLRRPLPARMPLCVTLNTGEFERMAQIAEQKELERGMEIENTWWRGWFGGGGPGVRAKTMTFVDDEWDGSVADAFARAKIESRAGTNQQFVAGRKGPKNPVEQMGVKSILAVGERDPRREDEPPAWVHRVLVGSIRGQAGKSGIMKGDVVTHVNGETFTGDASALNDLLVQAYREHGNDGNVTIVVNADECTAEALRLRARVR